ncbi:ATP-binding protein [Mycoplasmopsis ciconiae]|uniref:ATP-binding protein n=1 Tax=Mycoplasmopsis ciconiae TaxID=561067 RepID=A0ABU7MKA6_9BACT|nr:ATP-binding protein [Mycoplasmopsis ciconiae]
MTKGNIINLIKYHSENNDIAFRKEAYIIADEFDKSGDFELSKYIMSLMSGNNVWTTAYEIDNIPFLEKVTLNTSSLPLPSVINDEIIGIINACKHNVGVNKFLFEGLPGSGKTESTKHIARILQRDLYKVNFNTLIDSKLGQTNKNIDSLFKEINNLSAPDKIIILFDEIDALALDRLNSADIREMGRATSAVLKGLDELDEKILLIATTNLYEFFDKALKRRFDKVINFDRYTYEDLLSVALKIYEEFLVKFNNLASNKKVFQKIIKLYKNIPYPGELKNIIKTSLAFSNFDDKYDYLRKLYFNVTKSNQLDVEFMKKSGFTSKEIELLSGVSKSTLTRD